MTNKFECKMSKLPFEEQEYKVLVKRNSETSPKYGCNPYERKVEELINFGVININKPRGPTSHEVSAYVQKILGINKSGHSGTLDPNVTGVLIIAVGRATKVVLHLLTAGKEYVTIMHLHKPVEEDKLRSAINEFIGKINQLPPIKSAVKRQIRTKNIYYIDILEIKDKDVLMKVGCQAGTYIRKLVHDIGQKLGSGAHMSELIRTKAAGFNDKDMWSLQDLTDALEFYKEGKNEKFIRKVILPVERAVSHMKKIWVIDSSVDSLCHGVKLKIPGIAKLNDNIEIEDNVAIMTLKDELVAVGQAKMSSDEIMKNDKGICVAVDQVFMQPGTYAKLDGN